MVTVGDLIPHSDAPQLTDWEGVPAVIMLKRDGTYEGWVYVYSDKTWQWQHGILGTTVSHATFVKIFPNLPDLPTKAFRGETSVPAVN
jgi:hypothetical protein